MKFETNDEELSNYCLLKYTKGIEKNSGLNAASDVKSNKTKNYLQNKIKILIKSQYIRAGFYAQIVSILICFTGIFNSELKDTYDINIPTAQSVFNYILLFSIYFPIWFCYEDKLIKVIKTRWWKYFFVALADVEANYLIIKAYSLTIITTIQVIDAFILPITLVLSYYLLRLNYRINNVIGVMGCLLGCGLIVLADYLVHIEDVTGGFAQHRISGDLLCFFSSILYALSNVMSEIFIKESSKLEYLSMMGFFGSIISIIQMFLLERYELQNLIASSSDFINMEHIKIWVLFAFESISMFSIYSIVPSVLEASSAAFLNVNLLTSDFYSVLVGIFLKQYKLHYLYFIGLICIFFGTILYSLNKPISRDKVVSEETHITKEMKVISDKNSHTIRL